jgi:hypothetical protein
VGLCAAQCREIAAARNADSELVHLLIEAGAEPEVLERLVSLRAGNRLRDRAISSHERLTFNVYEIADRAVTGTIKLTLSAIRN